MKLYFIRHATASDIGVSDAKRELTDEGREEARIAGRALANLEAKPSRILTSPLVRAVQTAEIVAEELKRKVEVGLLGELTNDATTAALLKRLKPYSEEDEIALVGHMPGLSIHIAALIGAKNHEGLPLGKGGIACVELKQLRAGTGELRWLMRQKQLSLIAS